MRGFAWRTGAALTTPAGFAVTGVAVLALENGRRVTSPLPLACAVSRSIADAGDAVPRIVP